jgi:citrate synthase
MSAAPLRTVIWRESPEADNPFATRQAWCHGFDVYGQMLGHARWADMVYLLFKGQVPTAAQAALLDALAVALANPGPRAPSVHAAMCGGIGGSVAAASLMAALAVDAGQSGGAHEVFQAMQVWAEGNFADAAVDGLSVWRRHWGLAAHVLGPDDVWPEVEHPPGFDPHGVSTPLVVRQVLDVCAALSPGACLPWLQGHLAELESLAGLPLALTGVAAAAFHDLGLSPVQGEMLFLLLRLPGAAVHALEQSERRYQDFPFPPLNLKGDPA